MSNLQPTIQVVAYAVVDQGRLLIVRKRNTDKFMFPGGKLNPGEGDLTAVMREVREELSCEVVVSSVVFLGEFETMAANEPNTRLVARVYQGLIKGWPIASNEIEELRWLTREDHDPGLVLAPLLTDCVLPMLQKMGMM